MKKLDKRNQDILKLLRANSRLSWQDIGKKVNLTGQAVASRVQNMQEQGVISGFTIAEQNTPQHFITVFMDTNHFSEFEQFMQATEKIKAAYAVIGEGCYHLVFVPEENADLQDFLQSLLRYGRYKVSSSLRSIK